MDRACRRTVLAAGVALLAGCTTGSSDDGASSDGRGSVDDTLAGTDGDGSNGDGAAAESGETTTGSTAETSLADVRLEPTTYLVGSSPANDTLGVSPGAVVPEEAIPPVLREALYDALAGGFETDSPDPELLGAIDEFRGWGNAVFEPYVRLDGTAYEFDPSVPTLVAELDDEVVEGDPDRVVRATENFESEAVERFVRTLTEAGTHRPRQTYRASKVPEPVEAFLDRYEYVEDPVGVSRIETETVDAEPPYAIEVRELTDEDWWGRAVLDADDLDADLRRFFEAAVTSDHREPAAPVPDHAAYFADDVPDAYAESAWADEDPNDPFVRIDGTVYHISVTEVDHESVPVDVSAESEPPTEDGRSRFALAVRATGGGPETGGARIDAVEIELADGVPTELWIEADGEHRRLEPDEPDGDASGSGFPGREYETLPVGDGRSTTYALPSELPPGTHVSRGVVRVRWPGTDRRRERASYPFTLAIELDAA